MTEFLPFFFTCMSLCLPQSVAEVQDKEDESEDLSQEAASLDAM